MKWVWEKRCKHWLSCQECPGNRLSSVRHRWSSTGNVKRTASPHKFAPSAIHGAERRALFGEPLKTADLVITSYALLRRDISRYEKIEFATVVLDEAQHIKNPDSQNAQSAFSLKAKRRLALTGTPVENSLADIWSLMNFLMPGYLGSRQEFRERFQRPIESAQGGAVHRRLIKRLAPCILRRLKKSVLTELPDKIEHVAYCELYRVTKRYLHTTRKYNPPTGGRVVGREGSSPSSNVNADRTAPSAPNVLRRSTPEFDDP